MSDFVAARFGQIQPDGTYLLGMYGRVDRTDPERKTILWDQTAKIDACKIEVEHPDSHWGLKFVEDGLYICFLNLPDQPIGRNARYFELRPARGGQESPMIGTWSDGSVIAAVKYNQDGRPGFSGALLLEPWS